MNNIIKQIMNIIGDVEGSQLSIDFYPGENIVFNIYETEVPIVFDKINKRIYVDCESMNHKLTADMLNELHLITKLLNDNIDILLDLI